jgi:F0F1-type ATP synthase membrane subunit b/b'
MLEFPPDITFWIQIPLFLLFAAILDRLVLRPTQQVLAERARRTTGAREEAARLRDESEAMRRELEAAIDKARHAGSSAGEGIRREAEERERTLIEQAHHDAATTLDDMRRRVAQEAVEIRSRLDEQARSLAKEAAGKVLGRAVEA